MIKSNRFIPIILYFTVLINVVLGLSDYDDYWQQFVYYKMDVSLDPSEHLLSGESTIKYINNSPDELNMLYMHLYPNAFQEGSVKHREYQTVRYSGGISKDNPSYIEIKQFEITGEDRAKSNNFKIDDTILSAQLSPPLIPGDSIIISLTWNHKVRKHAGRAGYDGKQYDFAQWYPKMVVYDEKGWHNIPFHAIGEFYGEFGNYEVAIDVPKYYIIGASGVVINGEPGWESVTVDTSISFFDWLESRDSVAVDSTIRRSVTFLAENVHDFAWVASPDFVYEHGSWGGHDVHVLYNTSVGEEWTKVVRERGERALEWLTTKFGSYPYPQVTITNAYLGGGMEYPMLVMNGSEREGLIVHEIGHIWFYGILGNNEVDEAWLDEGFTSFQTRWYEENRYPPYGIDFDNSQHTEFQKKHWSFTSRTDRDQWRAIDFMTGTHNKPIASKSYLSEGYNVYRQNAYSKPSLMLQSLRYVLGHEVFDKAMQTYYSRWKLKHPNEARFRETMEEVSGQELDWFFDQWLHKTFYTDYALDSWSKKQLSNGSYEVSLTIIRRGAMQYPLDVSVEMKNGEIYKTRWNNFLDRWEDEFTFNVPNEPTKVILDPDNGAMDVDLTNNYSGIPPHHFRINWPGMNYNPRSAYVVKWQPVLYFHEKDGFKPGISLQRSYHSWSRLKLTITAGIESGKIHGDVQYSKSLRTFHPNLRYSATAYSLEGVTGGNLDFDYKWSKWYGYPPKHKVNTGIYFANANDSGYTDLYEEGTTVVFYGRYGLDISFGGIDVDFNIDVSSAPAGLSDWSFARLTTQFNFKIQRDNTGFAFRTIGGTMSYGDRGVPIQEKYTIQAAGAGDWFSNPYLRHPSSLFNLKVGDEFVRNRIHVYGDASLRGYYDRGFEGAEHIITQTIEVTHKLPVSIVNLNARAFYDGGVVWSDADNLEGELLMDAGVGVSIRKKIQGFDLKFRIDSPFWVSYTGFRTDRFEQIDFSRWVIGFDVGL